MKNKTSEKKNFSNQKGFIDQKGQAALIDSLFFLGIVSVICTSLFFFTINYGSTMERQVNSFYSRDFASDALKVVSYINVMRNGNDVFSNQLFLEDASKEYDYLFALMKEDYSDKREFSCQTRRAIKSTVSSVLRPFDDSFDYAFYVFRQSDNKFLFLMMAVHECSDPQCTEKNQNIDYASLIERKYYYCAPESKDVLEKKVFPYLGQVDTSIGKVTFSEPGSNDDTKGIPHVMGLSLWVSKSLAVLNNLSSPDSEFNCVEIPQSCPDPVFNPTS